MAAAAALASERRDFHGRWAKSGSGTAKAATEHMMGLRGKLSPRELNEYDTRAYTREKLDPLASGRTPAQDAAVEAYTSSSYEINAAARGDQVTHPRISRDEALRRAGDLSSAARPLPDDLIVLREIKGKDALARFSPGDVIADDAFASTTLRPGEGYAAGRDDTTVMHILLPKGTPVIWAGTGHDELILDRGTPMILVSPRDAGARSGFVTRLNLLALPKNMAPEGGTR